MKFRISKFFKHILLFLIIFAILFSILISITKVNADSDLTSETTYYEGYWKEESEDYNDKEKSYAELYELTRLLSQSNDAPSITVFVHVSNNWNI